MTKVKNDVSNVIDVKKPTGSKASVKKLTGSKASVVNSKKTEAKKMRVNQESSEALWNKVDQNKTLSKELKDIKVLKYGEDKLHFTKNLSIFKKCDYNRDIAIKGAMKIIDSVRKSGTWLNQIVVVNPDMEVISGQNTLVAAKLLGVGVYYVISEDRNPELLVQGEVDTRWKDVDSLKTYAKTNKTSAKFYKFFIDANKELKRHKVEVLENNNKKIVNKYKNITLPQLIAITYKQPKMVYGIKANGGAHLLNKLNDFNRTEELNTAIKIVALAQKVCTGDGIKRYPFLIGLLTFMYDNKDGIAVDYDKLLQKISVLKVTAGKPDDYYKQIKTVYQ